MKKDIKIFTKEEVLGVLKGMALEAFYEGRGESFVEWITDQVQESEREFYTAHDVHVIMHAKPEDPVGIVKNAIAVEITAPEPVAAADASDPDAPAPLPLVF